MINICVVHHKTNSSILQACSQISIISSSSLKPSSHMHDTARHDSIRHGYKKGLRHDNILVWCHTYNDTTMRPDSDSQSL